MIQIKYTVGFFLGERWVDEHTSFGISYNYGWLRSLQKQNGQNTILVNKDAVSVKLISNHYCGNKNGFIE